MSKTFLFQAIQFIQTVLIQFSINIDFVYTVRTGLYLTNQFSLSIVSMSKTVPFQTIQFSISTQINCQKCLFQFIQTVLFQTIQFSISMQLVLFTP